MEHLVKRNGLVLKNKYAGGEKTFYIDCILEWVTFIEASD